MLLNLKFHPSRQLAACLIALHAGALLCLIFAHPPLWLTLSSGLLCLYSAWHSVRRYALLHDYRAIIAATAHDNSLWRLQRRDGEEWVVHLLGDSWRSRYMIILNFKLLDSRKRVSVIVFKDTLTPAAFRRLGVYLSVNPPKGGFVA